MTDSSMHYALREMRSMFGSRLVQMILIAVAVLLGISGPFGTLEAMPFGPRLAYWCVTVPLTYALGVFVSAFVAQSTRNKVPLWPARVMISGATGLTVGVSVALLNWLALGQSPFEMGYIGPLMVSVIATAMVVAFVLILLSDDRFRPSDVQIAPPALMDRLEFDKRGALISLSVQDHYVEVMTNKGASLILMRLSDAIRETAPVDGLQVHRSHWVALNQITATRRDGDKAILTLSNGREIPASRSNIKALKERGVLPR